MNQPSETPNERLNAGVPKSWRGRVLQAAVIVAFAVLFFVPLGMYGCGAEIDRWKIANALLRFDEGEQDEAIKHFKQAIRLDPQTDYLWRLGYAQFHTEQYDEAARTLYRATKRNPNNDWNHLLLGAAYGHLGREEEARQAVETFNRLRFELAGKTRLYTIADLEYWSIKNEAGLERLRVGMRKAGVPEK